MAEIVTHEKSRKTPATATTGPGGRFESAGSAARVFNAILGAWLFLSAFVFAHTPESRTNTWISGALVVLFALIAMRAPAARFVNTAIAVWVFVTAFSFPFLASAAVWNNWIVAVVIFFVSLIPGGYIARPPHGGGRKVAHA
jgi:hypothetical protein